MSEPLPVPPDLSEESDHHLWIGNLDSRLTEFSLLKILQKFGSLKKFDFLYHKSGPEQGKSRGYCFVSYESRENAERAMAKMNGKLVLSKRLIVKWAHKDPAEDQKSKSHDKESVEKEDVVSPQSKIKAIEAKLQKMQEDGSTTSNLKPLPGTSQLSMVQREARKMEQANANKQTKKPYKR